MTSIVKSQIRIRRKTATQWQNENPVLAEGELGLDLTNKKIKVGDGSTAWNSLPYITVSNANQLENHNHDLLYAPLTHNHDSSYASITHNHDGVYQPVLTNSSNITVNSLTTSYVIGNQDTTSSTIIDWNTVYHNRNFNTNQTLTFSNAANGKSVTLIVYNSSTSNITLTFPSGIKWSDTNYTTVSASKYNIYTFIQINGVIFCSYVSGLS